MYFIILIYLSFYEARLISASIFINYWQIAYVYQLPTFLKQHFNKKILPIGLKTENRRFQAKNLLENTMRISNQLYICSD